SARATGTRATRSSRRPEPVFPLSRLRERAGRGQGGSTLQFALPSPLTGHGTPERRKAALQSSDGIGLLPSPSMSSRPATPAVAGHLYWCGPSMGREEKNRHPCRGFSKTAETGPGLPRPGLLGRSCRMNLESIKSRVPDYAKDLRLNLDSV